MKLVVFAGGTGKRFWPVSRAASPKQFLPIGGEQPLLKQRVQILLSGFAAEDIYISSGKRYEAELRQMLPEIPAENFILEPEMRDTGPAVTLAVAHLHHLFPGEAVSIQWSDHLIKQPEKFIAALQESEAVLSRGAVKTVFITVPARFPSPHRGYINFSPPSQSPNDVGLREFVKFVEKPDVQTAEQYISTRSYGWNPGYWTLQPEFYLEIMQKYHPQIAEVCTQIASSNWDAAVVAKFSDLDRNSADYLFAENVQASDAKVLLIDFGWSDVGEWIALKEALQESDEANVAHGLTHDVGSKDTIIYNTEEGKLVATLGLDGFVVVNTPEIVAVFPKGENAKLKQLLKELEEQKMEKFL